MNLGVTGHQQLEDDTAWLWVREMVEQILGGQRGSFVGVTSLAIGADQLFAELVLAEGGRLHVVIPFNTYEETFANGRARQAYSGFLAAASTVETLPGGANVEESYYTAGKRVVELCDELLAVWDGRPAKGKGGTADIVRYALDRGTPVTHIDTHDRTVRRLGGYGRQ